VAITPAEFDRNVLAFHKPGLAQTLAKRSHKMPETLGRTVPEKPNHRHRPLLRARGERPGDGRTAENCDELSASHWINSRANIP
jgi:hypothetical protein